MWLMEWKNAVSMMLSRRTQGAVSQHNFSATTLADLYDAGWSPSSAANILLERIGWKA